MKDNDDKRWDHIKQELKSALCTWEDLSLKNQNALSVEEKKIQELKLLLSDLKNKINELSKP
jgi:hypothetical protein